MKILGITIDRGNDVTLQIEATKAEMEALRLNGYSFFGNEAGLGRWDIDYNATSCTHHGATILDVLMAKDLLSQEQKDFILARAKACMIQVHYDPGPCTMD